ncbi:outer membrane beta-barrel protein [Parabacteroides sp. Marseille-P3160]|uniref:outer membrane beta-barrel protein n=1 Tax=Parabacteroides sp. Marseille-P3160 TaxID=1917887 RepID=UPI0009BBC310|nr:outer membrane beta-barrel protein [Parabacteroides sp. Marseille-P3160]
MKDLFFFLLLLIPIPIFSQTNIEFLGQSRYSIRGIVIDSVNREPVEMAVAGLYTIDNKLIKAVATNESGVFTFNDLALSRYNLAVSFLGYDTARVAIPPASLKKQTGKPLVADTIYLKAADIMLSEVTITIEPPELVVKEDTLEYNAAAFKVAEGAVVEDLIKMLPGMEVDTDGNIKKPDGKQVRRVYVDGKEFFGDDPKMATKNLTADIVDKVQVIEKKSDMAILTGIDDGEEETIINITIKKGMKKGWMGNVTSGLGALTRENKDNDLRYTESAMLNRFLENDQISFIANANNINNQGSTDRGNNIRSGRSRSGRSGITSSNTFGINTAKIVNDKMKFGGNVMYDYSDSYAENDQFRQNLLKDSVSYRKSLSTDRDYSNNFSFDGKLEYQMDSSTQVVFSPSLSYNYSKSRSSSFQVTMAGDADSSKVNESNSEDWMNTNGFNTRLRLDVSRKLSAKGRRISLGANYSLNKSSGSGMNASENIFYRSPDRNEDRDQKLESNQDRFSYNLSLSYVEPVWNNNFLDFSYSIDVNNTENRRKTLDYEEETEDYTYIDPDYNKSSNTKTINQNFRTNFRSIRPKYSYNIGLRIAPARTSSKSFVKDWYASGNDSIVNELPGRTATNYAPQLNFTYRFSNSRELRQNLRFRYNGSTSQPSVSQLDPTTNNTNPLHIRNGNPDLLPAFNHNISLDYDFNNRETYKVFTVNLSHQFTQNQIINYTTYEENTGIQYTKPINENGTWSSNATINYSKPFDAKKRVRFSSRSNLGYNNRIGYTTIEKQTERNISKTLNAAQDLNLSYSNDFFYGQIRGRVRYSKTSNEVIVNQQGTESFNYTFTYNTNLQLPYSFAIASDINYTANRGLSSGYNLNETIWNAQVSKQFLKQNRGSLRLQINDILQQRLSIRRNITADYIEDVRNNAMTGYFMVSFSYRFNNIRGPQRNRSREVGDTDFEDNGNTENRDNRRSGNRGQF